MERTGEDMDADRERRKLALRNRVKAKLSPQTQASEDELVVTSEELVVSQSSLSESDVLSFVREDANRVQTVASVCILIGSILGIIS